MSEDKDINDLKVGDFVGFKCDIEQSAEIIKIKKERDWAGKMRTTYVVKAGPDGFCGQYIGRYDTHEVEAGDCW